MRGAFLLAALLCGFLPAAAEAQSVAVFGESRGRACFEAAERGGNDLLSLAACDAALADVLSLRDRTATLVNRGVIHLRRKSAVAAEADFRAALGLMPDAAAATSNLGAARLLAGDPAGAAALITEALAAGTPEPHEALFNRALAYEALGRNAEALADYQAAAALAPDWAAPREEIARFQVSQAGS